MIVSNQTQNITQKRKEDKLEERTQIKFENPDIDGTPSEKLITLEQENPIEGESTREDGQSFYWHKWLCVNNEYFMASDTLDAMLKCLPDRSGKPIKIQKVASPTGGFPYFLINGMSKDDLAKQNNTSSVNTIQSNDITPVMPPQQSTAPASNTNGSLERLERKLDEIIGMLKKEEIPF